MKYVIFICFFICFHSVSYADTRDINVKYKIEVKLGYEKTDNTSNYKLIINEKENYYSITNTSRDTKYSNRSGDLKFLGNFGGMYFLILKNSGYTYIYSPPNNDNNNIVFDQFRFDNVLKIVDPRLQPLKVYIANCTNI